VELRKLEMTEAKAEKLKELVRMEEWLVSTLDFVKKRAFR
jgi:hypothetical protein